MYANDMEELKETLNKAVSIDNLTQSFVLLLSRELDIMIVDYYRKRTNEEDGDMKTNIP